MTAQRTALHERQPFPQGLDELILIELASGIRRGSTKRGGR
jgi:hypothetical protein